MTTKIDKAISGMHKASKEHEASEEKNLPSKKDIYDFYLNESETTTLSQSEKSPPPQTDAESVPDGNFNR